MNWYNRRMTLVERYWSIAQVVQSSKCGRHEQFDPGAQGREERVQIGNARCPLQAGHPGRVWKNRFSTPLGVALTIFFAYLLYLAIPPAIGGVWG